MRSKKDGVLFLQKGYGTTMEFCGYNDEKGEADFTIDLGDVDIRNEMSKKDLIAKLEDAVKKLKKYNGNVFVVQ
jgi:hypothetical protein